MDEMPRCYYCGRFAFEMSFEDLPVCENCIETLSGNREWALVRSSEGIAVTSFSDLSEFIEVLDRGDFKSMWRKCNEMADDK